MKKDIIVILGPTASGKSSLALKVANEIECELISADSMQIYKKMDVGTAKPSKEELSIVKHHMIDVVYPDEDFNVADFKQQSFDIVKDLHSDNKTPVFVGGTGLYVNSIVYDLDFSATPSNEEFRNEMIALKEKNGLQYMYDLMKAKDPEAAKRIHFNDEKRIIRRLEIIENEGVDAKFDFLKMREDYNFKIYGLNCERSILYDRINERVDIMIDQGLFLEVEELFEEYGDEYKSLKAIGYKEIIEYLKGNYDKDEAIRLVKRNSRRFAKRQITWFKRDDRINWYDISQKNCLNNILSGIK